MKFVNKLASPKMEKKTHKGATLQDVAKAMDKSGFWGRYNYAIEWTYKTQNGALSQVTVTCNPKIIMPVWAGWKKADKDSQKKWDIMWVKLKRHEENHHAIVDKAFKELKKTLEKDKSITEKTLPGKLDAWMKAIDKAQKDYDKKSDHGKKEGVML